MLFRKINPSDHRVKYALLMGAAGFLGTFLTNGVLVLTDVIESINWAGIVGISAAMFFVSLLMRPMRISFGSKSSGQEGRGTASVHADGRR